MVAGVAGDYEAVDDERVLARREQPGEPDVAVLPAEDVVLGNDAAGWEPTSRVGHRFRDATELDLLFEQSVACRAVRGRLSRKGHAHRLSSLIATLQVIR